MTDIVADRPATAESALLAGLNDAQRQAVAALDGAVLVLAGAGTGKTRVVTTRLAHILDTGRAFPAEILRVTFPNKAAAEVSERLEPLIGRAGDGSGPGAFHPLAGPTL